MIPLIIYFTGIALFFILLYVDTLIVGMSRFYVDKFYCVMSLTSWIGVIVVLYSIYLDLKDY